MGYQEQLEIKTQLAVESLKSEATSLKNSMEILLTRLEKGNLKLINGLGEVQGMGSKVDVKCMELKTLLESLESIKVYEKNI